MRLLDVEETTGTIIPLLDPASSLRTTVFILAIPARSHSGFQLHAAHLISLQGVAIRKRVQIDYVAWRVDWWRLDDYRQHFWVGNKIREGNFVVVFEGALPCQLRNAYSLRG